MSRFSYIYGTRQPHTTYRILCPVQNRSLNGQQVTGMESSGHVERNHSGQSAANDAMLQDSSS